MAKTGTDAILTGAPVTATGGIRFTDVGATLPLTATEALDTKWLKGGYVGEDGVTRTTDASDDKIKAWGGDTVKIVRTEHSISYTFQFMESANADVLKLIHGEQNVEIDGEKITVNHTSQLPERKSYVIDMLDSDSALREVIPNGQIASSGDVAFVHSDVIRYEVTIEAFPHEGETKAISLIGPLDETPGGSVETDEEEEGF